MTENPPSMTSLQMLRWPFQVQVNGQVYFLQGRFLA